LGRRVKNYIFAGEGVEYAFVGHVVKHSTVYNLLLLYHVGLFFYAFGELAKPSATVGKLKTYCKYLFIIQFII